MFEQVTLIEVKERINKNGESIEIETPTVLPVVFQTVKREQRDKYNERGAGRYLRFKISLFGKEFDTLQFPYFEYNGIRYSVTDFVRDVTDTSYYVEGTSSKGR